MTILSGIVEIDECYIGGFEENKHSNKKLRACRGTVGKTAVVGMRDRKGQVVAKVAKAAGGGALRRTTPQSAIAGSMLHIDKGRLYIGLGAEFTHKTLNRPAQRFLDGIAHTNGMENVWDVLKRGFCGAYHSFNVKHLQRYPNEFMFRLDLGNVKVHTLDRIDSMLRMTVGKRPTYDNLVKH